ncbi:serine hydrolase domain-containing protein [Alterisphingorhabdus coralli]|uniref:Serine hydrolase domain-containing protein n=1 Tax=Alterisphingorhabdus coralli TaxID=3071408 RepID=A0AA97F7M9_9SPHN|nr:serine hydrolase domain-containing protein [Parasphingorhabdus sp. SCSIO 66989]WOE75879.1 serine hydrolase domain-containing protein [Parasphingorhabdus sp. SCSIO 66989]
MSACAPAAIAQDSQTQPDAATTQSDAARIARFETQLKNLRERDDPDAKRWTIEQRMENYGVPGMGVAIINNGKIILAKGYGTQSANSDEPVDANTVFSAGSVSKVINAALILRLVQEGKLDLDTDINDYLTSWKVPENEHSSGHKVTLRMLLSHTSGFSQHGFEDFLPEEALPTALQTLNGEAPAKHEPVRILFTPGSKMKYSGGGITVSQVLVEDVTGMSYAEAARAYVFEPLGMTRSTFASPLPESHGNIAKAHDKQGRPKALPRGYESFPEIAASGLWTSASDMARFVLALMQDEAFLTAELRADMLTRVPLSWHGLGPRINGEGDMLAFHHGGANDHYQSWIEGQPAHGNGFITLSNGEAGRPLGYELRFSADAAFGWPVPFPDGYREPDLGTSEEE